MTQAGAKRTASETRVARIIARYPRCHACGKPMCCGQKDTHLSCRTSTNPEGK